jgi:SAM-dependent methyltransferase
MKLNLGCSSNHREGFVNVDIVPPADQIANLNFDWPWQDSSIDYILAIDLIEHLPEKIHTLNELWRVLKPGAIAEIEVPIAGTPCAVADPTHCSLWDRLSFSYFEHGHELHAQYANPYGIKASFVVGEEYTRTMKYGPKLLIKLKAIK